MTEAEALRAIFLAAAAAVDPFQALLPHLESAKGLARQEQLERVVVAGFGKAALPMALAAEKVFGSAIDAGLVIAPHGCDTGTRPARIEVATAGHPHPDANGVAAARRIVALAEAADSRTLFLLLVSGGGSALFTLPAPEIALQEQLDTARLLMNAGADIVALNTVRKHLSAVKGGRLAVLAHPARIVTLVISDVVGDPLDVIASGPAVPDPTTFVQALDVLEQYRLLEQVPPSVRLRLEAGARGTIPETPKPGDPVFGRVSTVVAARNRDALEAAARKAQEFGFSVRVTEEPLTGEAREAGKTLAAEALSVRKGLQPGERVCLVSGGETTVRVSGKGKGGRNQEVALSFALEIAGVDGITLLSAGTDGIDGPTDAAGGIVNGNTIPAARREGADPASLLAENDSYPALKMGGSLFRTGPTGTNVMDLQVILVTKSQSM